MLITDTISVYLKKIFVLIYRINCYNAFAAQTPFGGCKMSGKGKEM